jgi:nitrogen regulatory protein P-II 2
MRLTPMRLVTVIASEDIEKQLVAELKQLGASGYTVLPARGEGHHGARTSSLEGANVQIEAIVDPATADRIVERLHTHYQPRFQLVVYVGDIEVVRAEKFAPPGGGEPAG